MNTIGKAIKEKRKEKNITQAKLADAVGVSQSTIGKYETGDNIPSFEMVKKIAKALGTNAFVLLGEEESQKLSTDEILAVAEDVRKQRDAYVIEHAEDIDYIKRLRVPALKLNDLGRQLLLDNAESMAANTELTKK